jgi:hypothetical protein
MPHAKGRDYAELSARELNHLQELESILDLSVLSQLIK